MILKLGGVLVYSSAAFESPASGVYSDHEEDILSLLMMRQQIKIWESVSPGKLPDTTLSEQALELSDVHSRLTLQ